MSLKELDIVKCIGSAVVPGASASAFRTNAMSEFCICIFTGIKFYLSAVTIMVTNFLTGRTARQQCAQCFYFIESLLKFCYEHSVLIRANFFLIYQVNNDSKKADVDKKIPKIN